MAFKVIGYGRASTDKQVCSTAQQEAICRDVFALKKRIHPEWAEAEWGGFFADEATCRETILRQRHAGSLVLAQMRPGDRIICSAHDRMFCDMIDFCQTMNLAAEMRFFVVVGDKEIDPRDEDVMLYNKILTAMAERELQKIRRRTREALAYRREAGLPSGKSPVGWKTVTVKVPGQSRPVKRLVRNNAHRRLARELLQIYRREGSYRDTAWWCNHNRIRHPNGNRWNAMTMRTWCLAAKREFVLPNGSHEAAPIPPGAVPVEINTISPDD